MGAPGVLRASRLRSSQIWNLSASRSRRAGAGSSSPGPLLRSKRLAAGIVMTSWVAIAPSF
jgi:hypothetical protein